MAAPGIAQLASPELRRARVMMVLRHRLGARMTNANIAKTMNMSVDTVERDLVYARKNGLAKEFEDQILQDLVPLAIGAVRNALAEGDADVAIEILKGTGLLKKPSDRAAAPAAGEESLEIYMRRIRGGTDAERASQFQPAHDASRALPPAGQEVVHEGVVCEVVDLGPAAEPPGGGEPVGASSAPPAG